MTSVITVNCDKGGTSKTTLTTTIAAGLAIKGFRSLIIDTDPQGQAAYIMGMAKEPCFYDLIVRNARWEDAIRSVPVDRYAVPDQIADITGRLFIVPANAEVRNIANSISDLFVLWRRLQQLQSLIDFVVIDTSPSPSLLHAAIYAAADYVLYPTRCEELSLDGLRESISHLEEFNPFRTSKGLPPVQVLGIVPTMYIRNTIDHQDKLDVLIDEFGQEIVWEPIANRIAWSEAAGMFRTIFASHPNTRAYWDAMALVDHVLGMVMPS